MLDMRENLSGLWQAQQFPCVAGRYPSLSVLMGFAALSCDGWKCVALQTSQPIKAPARPKTSGQDNQLGEGKEEVGYNMKDLHQRSVTFLVQGAVWISADSEGNLE